MTGEARALLIRPSTKMYMSIKKCKWAFFLAFWGGFLRTFQDIAHFVEEHGSQTGTLL